MAFKLLNERNFQARGHYPAKPKEKPERERERDKIHSHIKELVTFAIAKLALNELLKRHLYKSNK